MVQGRDEGGWGRGGGESWCGGMTLIGKAIRWSAKWVKPTMIFAPYWFIQIRSLDSGMIDAMRYISVAITQIQLNERTISDRGNDIMLDVILHFPHDVIYKRFFITPMKTLWRTSLYAQLAEALLNSGIQKHAATVIDICFIPGSYKVEYGSRFFSGYQRVSSF